MSIIIGLDVGGSTTKIVGLSEDGCLLSSMMVRAYDQVTSIYGALGHYAHANSLPLNDVERIMITGVGASFVDGDIYGIPTHRIDEFSAIARGGLALSGLDEAVVVSMGTGTAFIHAKNKEYVHIGGSGVGGGTLAGLGAKLAGINDFEGICRAASKGNLRNVDLVIGDISKSDISSLKLDITAANFANIKDTANDSDMALGLINMVLQTILTLAVFACGGSKTNRAVLTGAMVALPQLNPMVKSFSALYPTEFIVPGNAAFATAVGAALHTV